MTDNNEGWISRWIDPHTRFFMQVNKTESCWNWTGHKAWNGYGAMRINGTRTRAHRVSWLIHKGSLTPDQLVLHKCDNPACVNPDHLYLGDQKQNAKDRDSRGRNGFTKRTHCKKGHELTELNIYHYKGKRLCRTCRRKPLPSPPRTKE